MDLSSDTDFRKAEERALEKVLLCVDEICGTLSDRLTKVDYEAQRKILENEARTCELAKSSAYFGVLSIKQSGSGSNEVYRIGKFGPIFKGGDLLVAPYFGPLGRLYVEDSGTETEGFKASIEIVGSEIRSIKLSRSEIDGLRRDLLLRPKTGQLGDIIETIRPDQDDLVRKDGAIPLVVNGGPGTGKTVVGLQRLAFLLFNAADDLLEQQVAVIGPSTAYIDYVKGFLANLGQVRADHFDFQTMCLFNLASDEREFFNLVRRESFEIRIEKNKPLIDLIIREAIWGEVRSFAVQTTLNRRGSAPKTIYLSGEEIALVYLPIREKFRNGASSLEDARDELGRNLQNLILKNSEIEGSPSVAASGFIQRRDQRLDTWLLKIGLHSQEKRFEWLQILSKPSGGRIRREFESVLNDFYVADIDKAIDEISHLCTMEPAVLRRHLHESGVKPKNLGELEEQSDLTAETLIIALNDFSFDDTEDITRGAMSPQIKSLLNQVLPLPEALKVSESICSGDNEAFSRIGNQGRSLARKFSENARMNGSGKYKYEWTDADLPIVAEVNFAITGESKDYFHVLIDEAQDLSRMESKVLSRIVRGRAITVLGDPNQSTTTAAIADWDGLVQIIAPGEEYMKFELEHNYRVPETISDYAAQYLPESARVSLPTCDLEGGLVAVIDTESSEISFSKLLELINSRNIEERYALITEDDGLIEQISPFTRENLVLLGPTECKGLEVDHVVLYEPGEWYYEGAIPKKQMYVSLTRATKSVSIIQHNRADFSIVPYE